jgi:hypothetical protein
MHGPSNQCGINGDSMQGSYLGPKFSDEEIGAWLDEVGAKYHQLEEEQNPALSTNYSEKFELD